ncbi:hypothetical protein [Taklimakanibacter deserti]|uniref:hypothetical protein n=1 Tax=Taklimakanibacter deserti TaxID=2267839 RepID=UPI0034D69B01
MFSIIGRILAWPAIDAIHASCERPVMRNLFHFESKGQPLAAPNSFALRLMRNALWCAGIVFIWLVVGMAGYGGFEGMSTVDAFVNAAMILSGMGPVQPLNTVGGKIFAGVYAIISGIVIFGIAGIALAPLYHRMLHRFHLQDDEAAAKVRKK